jgi:hypothetical protein
VADAPAPAADIPAADAPANLCWIAIIYGTEEQERKRRRTDAQILKEQWEQLGCYKELNGDPLFEQFGMIESGGRRYSRRLYIERLLQGSRVG